MRSFRAMAGHLLSWKFGAACAAACALSMGSSAQAALVSNGLTGNTEFDGWVDLKAGTLTTADLTSGFGSNESGSGDGVLTRTSGSHYPAGSSLYSFSGNSTFEVSDTSALSDVNTVVFSILSWPNGESAMSIAPTLNFNGGTQAIAADYLGTQSYGTIDFGGPVETIAYTFQWDLSSIGDVIGSYDIDWGQIVHAGVLALQLESSDTFSLSSALAPAAAPEPGSVVLAGLGVLGMVGAFRRRRAET